MGRGVTAVVRTSFYFCYGFMAKLSYLVSFEMQSPSGRPTGRNIKVSAQESIADIDLVVSRAESKIEHLLKKGYRVHGGSVITA